MLTPAQLCVMRFEAMPLEDRGVSMKSFCRSMGISEAMVYRWRNNDDEYNIAVERAKADYLSSRDFHATCVRTLAVARLHEMSQPGQGTSADQRQAIRQLMELTKEYADDGSTVVDYSNLTDLELTMIAIGRKTVMAGVSEYELGQIARQLRDKPKDARRKKESDVNMKRVLAGKLA